MEFRTGFGYDVHPLREGSPFVMGGMTISHNKGTVGYSDADTLIHAICDALLGAAALGDVGVLFPDTSAEFKGIDSKILLKRTMEAVRQAGYELSNMDSTVCLQKPKIRPYIPDMVKILAHTMQVPEGSLSIKATTTEHLGFTGREEGVAAYATVLIYKK